MSNVNIETSSLKPLKEFLEDNDFFVEQITDNVFKVNRDEELPVFLNIKENSIYFEVDLGNISKFSSEELYFKLMDLNTEILPVSLGISSTNPSDPRLVLVESRQVKNLDDNEFLLVFDAMEIAIDKAESLLSQYIN